MGTSLFNTTPSATYPALIKVGDNTSIDGTLKVLSDGAGNDLPIQVSSTVTNFTGQVGVGTTTPIVPLNVYNSSASVSSVVLVEQDTSAIIGQINQYRKNGSVNLVSGAEIGRLSFGGYFNSTYSPFSQVCSAITAYYGGTGTDRVGGLRLTTWNGGGQTTRLQVAPDGKIAIGTTTATAKVQIVGEGSTSATTAFLVQNSLGTTLLQTLDDATTTLAGKTFTGTGTILVPSQAHSASDIVMKGDSALISANGNANQWGKIILCDSGANTTYQNYGTSHLFKIGTTSPTTYLTISANNIITGASTRITMAAQDASDIYQGTGANVYGSFLPFGGSGNTVFKNSYTSGSYRFFTAPAVDGTLVEALRITNTGNVGIGTTSPTATTHIKGSGSTSATTSFLVQNSTPATALQIKDDLTSTFGGSMTIISNDYAGIDLRRTVPNSLSWFKISATGDFEPVTLSVSGTSFLQYMRNSSIIRLNVTTTPTDSGTGPNGSVLIKNPVVYNETSTPYLDYWSNTGGGTGTVLARIQAAQNGVRGGDLIFSVQNAPAMTAGYQLVEAMRILRSGNVGIGTSTPDSSAKVDISSTTQGFLPPRMTTAERVAITTPANGLIVFDTDVQNLCYRRDSTWVQVSFTAV